MISINELGFAAFLLLNGCKLVEYKNREWIFISDKQESEWRVLWINSDFAKFDKFLLDLKNFRKSE